MEENKMNEQDIKFYELPDNEQAKYFERAIEKLTDSNIIPFIDIDYFGTKYETIITKVAIEIYHESTLLDYVE